MGRGCLTGFTIKDTKRKLLARLSEFLFGVERRGYGRTPDVATPSRCTWLLLELRVVFSQPWIDSRDQCEWLDVGRINATA
jgi:hypothetical protein